MALSRPERRSGIASVDEECDAKGRRSAQGGAIWHVGQWRRAEGSTHPRPAVAGRRPGDPGRLPSRPDGDHCRAHPNPRRRRSSLSPRACSPGSHSRRPILVVPRPDRSTPHRVTAVVGGGGGWATILVVVGRMVTCRITRRCVVANVTPDGPPLTAVPREASRSRIERDTRRRGDVRSTARP